MEAIYWLGFYLNLVCLVFACILLPIKLNSIFARNMASIGYRISWLSGEPVRQSDFSPKAINEYFWKFLGFVAINAVFALASWILIFLLFISYAKAILSFVTTPTEVRTARWRLKNVILDKEEIINQFCIIRGADASARERLRYEIDQHLAEIKPSKTHDNEVA